MLSRHLAALQAIAACLQVGSSLSAHHCDFHGSFTCKIRPFALRGFSSNARRLKLFVSESLNLDRPFSPFLAIMSFSPAPGNAPKAEILARLL